MPEHDARDGRGRAHRSVTAYRRAVFLFSLVFVGIGIALISVTAVHGGGVGYLLGALFIAVGAGRITLLRRR